jgi:hypothetical protein
MPSGMVAVESIAQWLRTLGYVVKAPEGGPPDDKVQVTIDENGHIHLVAPLTERTRASRPLPVA